MNRNYIKPFALITSDLAAVFWQPSRMASCFTSLSKGHSWFDKLTTNGLYGSSVE